MAQRGWTWIPPRADQALRLMRTISCTCKSVSSKNIYVLYVPCWIPDLQRVMKHLCQRNAASAHLNKSHLSWPCQSEIGRTSIGRWVLTMCSHTFAHCLGLGSIRPSRPWTNSEGDNTGVLRTSYYRYIHKTLQVQQCRFPCLRPALKEMVRVPYLAGVSHALPLSYVVALIKVSCSFQHP